MSRAIAVFLPGSLAIACSATPQDPETAADGTGAASSTGDLAQHDDSGGRAAPASTGEEPADATRDGEGDAPAEDGEDDAPADEGEDDGGGWDPNAIPASTGPCPDLTDGWNTFCPAGIDVCREAYVRRSSAGTGGPLNFYWHGTFENAVDVQNYGAGGAILDMTLAEGGLAFYPEADPDAVNRPNNPYPWWIVGSTMNGRKDDFFFLDEMIACAAEEGLVDLDRINTGGMSAGGIMTSNLVGRRGFWASAVSWSGGRTTPFTPPSLTPTMALHGGPSDCCSNYCGFMRASEYLAAQMDDAGAFAFLCDHSEGDTSANHHADGMGSEGAEFMALAVRDQPHPWEGYNFGNGGVYMLDNYCYAVGDDSPWAPWD